MRCRVSIGRRHEPAVKSQPCAMVAAEARLATAFLVRTWAEAATLTRPRSVCGNAFTATAGSLWFSLDSFHVRFVHAIICIPFCW